MVGLHQLGMAGMGGMEAMRLAFTPLEVLGDMAGVVARVET